MLLDKRGGPPQTFCVALCGMISALVLLLMFCSTMFPMLDYAIPTYAGFLMVAVIAEAGGKWAFLTYLSCAVLCPLMTPDYEANLLFIMFMGYYPILYVYITKNIRLTALRRLIKIAVFNIAVISFALIFQYLFTGVDLYEGLEMFGKYAPLALLGVANVFFFFYDRLLGMLTDMYTRWFRKRILTRGRGLFSSERRN